MALETSPEHPAPVRQITQAIGQWIDRLGAVWVEGQVTQVSRRGGMSTVFLTLRDKLAGLEPSFRKDGTITPANASPLNDGASAVLLAGEGVDIGIAPLARIAGRGVHALDPQDFGFAPVEAANKALARAGIT